MVEPFSFLRVSAAITFVLLPLFSTSLSRCGSSYHDFHVPRIILNLKSHPSPWNHVISGHFDWSSHPPAMQMSSIHSPASQADNRQAQASTTV